MGLNKFRKFHKDILGGPFENHAMRKKRLKLSREIKPGNINLYNSAIVKIPFNNHKQYKVHHHSFDCL